MNRVLSVTIVSVAALVSGCASKGTAQVSEPAAAPATTASASAPARNTVYFGFDQVEVNDGSATVLQDWATFLAGNPATSVRVEGHTDTIGSEEYNEYLGERRAQSVKSALVAGGASGAQVQVVSHGESRPTGNGHAQNRRVEIVR